MELTEVEEFEKKLRKTIDRVLLKHKGDVIKQLWVDEYVNGIHCSLCGNIGVIDTSNATTPNGQIVGRKNFCICPNGRLAKRLNYLDS